MMPRTLILPVLLMVGLPIIALGIALSLGLPDVYRSQGQIELEGAQTVERTEDEQPAMAGAY